MIINARTIIVTLLVISVAAYLGLRAIRAFALSIAQENHDAVAAMDAKEELDRTKRLRDADAAVAVAAAKVAPLLPSDISEKAKELVVSNV